MAARFHDSLHTLLGSMANCNPFFIRCLKPNNDKCPMKFDMPVVLEQLRYSGMLETIRIRQYSPLIDQYNKHSLSIGQEARVPSEEEIPGVC